MLATGIECLLGSQQGLIVAELQISFAYLLLRLKMCISIRILLVFNSTAAHNAQEGHQYVVNLEIKSNLKLKAYCYIIFFFSFSFINIYSFFLILYILLGCLLVFLRCIYPL